MALLRKVKGSTLMETLVASVLIVIVFMLSSMILNNIFERTIVLGNTSIENHLNELGYKAIHNKISLPINEDLGNWTIYGRGFAEGGATFIDLEAVQLETGRSIQKIFSYDKP